MLSFSKGSLLGKLYLEPVNIKMNHFQNIPRLLPTACDTTKPCQGLYAQPYLFFVCFVTLASLRPMTLLLASSIRFTISTVNGDAELGTPSVQFGKNSLVCFTRGFSLVEHPISTALCLFIAACGTSFKEETTHIKITNFIPCSNTRLFALDEGDDLLSKGRLANVAAIRSSLEAVPMQVYTSSFRTLLIKSFCNTPY